ncbi:PAS domain-containing sensor histidine kinase [Halobaculum sp. CBA1158]|uniref:two-component system sensor histidine kinase NtrB n=1 Tax=Halobaculum sp. CBA1158 TaxID=2904243 RepID=UPI001F373B6D|nr:PAS domain-containing sensor histidine kinase [Halobaculum sp. CBA1158]UIO98751.1 PAS domain-containing sensor histidine kinase [Halobaculum sp. CBA1158]
MTDSGDSDDGRGQRERDLRLYETVLESLNDAVYAIEPDGTIVYVNQRYAEMKGVDREALIGSDIYDWVTEETAERARNAREEMADGDADVGVIEYEFLTADGERFPVEMRFNRIAEGDDESGRVGVIRDVSKRKRREEALRRKNERLESFASIVSHDLRNPLNVLSGSLELARESDDPEHLDRAERAVEDMETLVEDLLMLAREGDVIDGLEPVALAASAESAWETATEGRDASATASIEAERRIVADPDRLEQLLENLFRNAIDHGGGDVHVVVADLDDGFRVDDDGPGIPDGERENVFERGRTTDPDGTGVGLSIVESIADAHGWSVAIDDADIGGASFAVRGVERPPPE